MEELRPAELESAGSNVTEDSKKDLETLGSAVKEEHSLEEETPFKEELSLDNTPSINDSSSVSTGDSEKSELAAKKNPLDDLTYEEVARNIDELDAEYKHLITENDMFERYLKLNDPQSLEGMHQMIENAIRLQKIEPVRRATLADTYSLKSYTSASKLESSIIGAGSIIDRGPRINVTQKTDMVMKDMEELQKSLNRFYKDSHKKKCALKAELEEVGIEIAEAQEGLNNFEQNVVIEGLDPLTQRIPAEKFVRYLQEWLKTSLVILQKYRLRLGTLTCQLRKLKEILKQKKELGESLHAVDFEKLQIENNHFLKEIDLRTIQLIDLKRINGGANLILTNQKKFLMKQMGEIKKIQKEIDDTKSRTEGLERETEMAEEQLEKVKAYYDSIKEMIDEYRVPDVMEYVRIKGRLYELQKNIKIWSRRTHLHDVALSSSIREMKNLTGSKKVLDSWFEFSHPHATNSDLDFNIDDKGFDEDDSLGSRLDFKLDL